MPTRTVLSQHPAYRDDIGPLVTRRPLPGPSLPAVGPFLFLNHHGPQVYGPDNSGLPFGPHPHRGFETVTFILAGELAHLDSSGHQSVIGAGGMQWMTAGSGLIHAEISPASFKRHGGPLEILQLWVNLPARLKMTPPAYIGLSRDQVNTIDLPGSRGKANLVSGQAFGHAGPVQPLTDVTLMTLELSEGAPIELPAPTGHTVLMYIVSGQVRVQDVVVKPWHMVVFGEEGDRIALEADTDAVVLYGHARPYNEPVVSHGPFVMNTQAEIAQAVRDYQNGLFGEVPDIHRA